ncbi:MAG: hypothetical protein P0107_01985 [Nitrosomonas sp.]|nr:hypothetical protein [Nitrosomonas sp.]
MTIQFPLAARSRCIGRKGHPKAIEWVLIPDTTLQNGGEEFEA